MFSVFLETPFLKEFIAMAIAHLIAVASPGPDFAVVSRYSVRFGARIGIWVSLGIALGILIHVTYSVLGLAIVIHQTPWLYSLLLAVAAGYFFWLAFLLLRSKPTSLAKESTQNNEAVALEVQTLSRRKAIGIGFLTNGLNIKATMFFLALFTSIISPQTPLWVKSGYGIYLAIATFAWFASLSLVLGKTRVRSWLLSYGYWFDRVMGVMLLLLAVNLVWQFYQQ